MPTYPIRRRARECKTCLNCRASKVRCDRKVPCTNCVKRDFTCSYGRPPPASSSPQHPSFLSPALAPAYSAPSHDDDHPYAPDQGSWTSDDQNSPEFIDVSQAEWDAINKKMATMEETVGDLHSIFNAHSHSPRKRPENHAVERKNYPRSEGVYGSNLLETGDVHLGDRSALIHIRDKSKGSEDTAQALHREDLVTDLALGNQSVAYPFGDLWSSDPFTSKIAGVCSVLPDDDRCQQLLRFYIDIGAVLYPVLPDLEDLECKANRLLEGRRQAGGAYKPDASGLVKPFGMDLPFLSLLFAVLASGCQLSHLPERDRELTSWLYISCAYQCLRMLNYVSQPTIEIIQILLIISNVLSYNMNAGASYTLLGMTERMCLVLGLHVESRNLSLEEQAVRRRVWWTMAFQNSHFSLAYDRPSITMVSHPQIPFGGKSMPGHRSYFETLCRIVSLALELLRARLDSGSSKPRIHKIRDYKHRIQHMIADAAPHLRYREYCQSLADHIERTELRLHWSYLLSVMCRVSLDMHAHLDDHTRALIREDCISSLIGTIDAFVELHEINSHCSRSWISLQRSIASAFLLVTNDDSPQTWALVDRLENVLADHVFEDGDASQNNHTDSAKHLASSLRALREIREAFRARKAPPDAPQSETFTPPVLPSPRSIDRSPEMVPNLATAGGMVNPMEGRNMQNILGQVSDVMLFPSMSDTSPAV